MLYAAATLTDIHYKPFTQYHVFPQAFEKASGKKVNYKLVDRRAGDSTEVYAATATAERELGWKAKLDINDMCKDQWTWASVRHPSHLPRCFLLCLICVSLAKLVSLWTR